MGVLALAGKVPRVLVTPTDDLGQVLNSVHQVGMEGTINFPTGVQVSLTRDAHKISLTHAHASRRASTPPSRPSPFSSDLGNFLGKKQVW